MVCAGLPVSDHSKFSLEGAESSFNGSKSTHTAKPASDVYWGFRYSVDIMLTVRSAN